MMPAPKFPQYKTVPTASLIPYARNARTHSPAQVDKIAASIREFGFLSPIITDGQSGIVAGHGRVMAAQKLGLDTLPTIDAAHLTEAQRRACVLAARYFPGMLLKIELQDLEAAGRSCDHGGSAGRARRSSRAAGPGQIRRRNPQGRMIGWTTKRETDQ